MKNLKKRFKWVLGLGSVAALIATASTVTPVITASSYVNQNKNDFDMNKVSSLWTNDNKDTKYVQNQFNDLLNFSNDVKNCNKTNSFLQLFASSTNPKNTQALIILSDNLKKLSPADQNKVKNQMLKMYKITSTQKITTSNYKDILKGFTTQNNIDKIQNQLQFYQKNKNTKINIDGNRNTDLFSSNITTIGQLINNLNIASEVMIGISGTAFLVSAAAWAVAWWFGISIPLAIASSLVGAVTGAFAGALSIASIAYQAQANLKPTGLETAYVAILSIYSLGSVTKALVIAANTTVVTVTAASVIYPLAMAFLSFAALIVGLLQN